MDRHRDSRPRLKRPPKNRTNGARLLPLHVDETFSVRLTRKLADVIDGVNLTDAHVGDRLELSQHDAEMLIAEGWAERAQAADGPRRKKRRPPSR
jgi:hypothetical protein